MFFKWPEEMAYIFYIHNFWAKVNPPPSKEIPVNKSVHERWSWLFFPLGTQQSFIGLINSLSLAALVTILAQLLAEDTVPLGNLIIGGVLLVAVSFVIHTMYSKIKHRRGVENLVTAAGTAAVWGSNTQ